MRGGVRYQLHCRQLGRSGYWSGGRGNLSGGRETHGELVYAFYASLDPSFRSWYATNIGYCDHLDLRGGSFSRGNGPETSLNGLTRNENGCTY